LAKMWVQLLCFKHILFMNTLTNGIGQQAKPIQALSLLLANIFC
jgi:hypothetical protein